jgi:regulator of RNase E activity RraA
MALIINPPPQGLLGADELAAWRDIPAAVISDELNRAQTLSGALAPLAPGMGFAAQALTVDTMVGDNGPLHYAVTVAWPGCALVVDAGGHTDTAVWGGILTEAAKAAGVVAVVVDGAVRDAAELRQSGIAVYATAIVPRGPHKGFGGTINAPIQCAGAAVAPGDLVVGDDDGVVVVRPDQMDGLMARCRARMAKEDEHVKAIAGGATTVALLGLPAPEDFA